MPPVPAPTSDYLLATLAGLHQRLSALEVQQQSIISNLQGQPVVALGLQPGSNPAEYGIGLLNKSFGTTLALFGEDASGNVGLKFFDGSGNLRILVDEMGIHVYDGSNNNRVNLGELGNGDYGLQVIDVLGNSEEILPAVAQYVDTNINITSTSYVSDGGPSVTVEVGASGKVLLTASSFIITNANGVIGYVGLFQDGTWIKDVLVASGTDIIQTNPSTTRIITGLSAGSHTFELQYKTSSSSSNFAARSLVVTPI